MSRGIRTVLATLTAVSIILMHSVVPSPPAEGSLAFCVATSDTVELIDLLPGSILLAVEIMDLVRGWSEISGVPAIGRVLDRLLEWSGLAPGDLPWLAGERAVLALMGAKDGD